MIPLEVDGNFTADASGNGTDRRIILSGHWSAVYASCQCAGSGQWVAGKLGRAQFFQQGANVVLGPIILQPGQQAQVTVAGATPNAPASIVYWGWQSDAEDGADLASVVPSIESAGSLTGSVPISLGGGSVGISGTVTTVGPQTKLGTVTAGAGVTVTNTFTVPTSATALMLAPAPPSGFNFKVTVKGHTSATIYLQSNFVLNTPLYCGTAQVEDAQVDITLDNTGNAAGATLDIVSFATPVFSGVELVSVDGTTIRASQDTSNGGTNSIPVVPAQFYNPAPWQEPSSTAAQPFSNVAAPSIVVNSATVRLRWLTASVYNSAASGSNGAALNVYDGTTAGTLKHVSLIFPPPSASEVVHLTGLNIVCTSGTMTITFDRINATTYEAMAAGWSIA